MTENVFPEFGFRRKGNDEYPEKWNQNLRPSLKQMIPLIPLGFRYLAWYLKCRRIKRIKSNIDQMDMWNGKRDYGVPMGGIGSGTIGRGFRGEFKRYQMIPGMYSHETSSGTRFVLSITDLNDGEVFRSILGSLRSKTKHTPSSWPFKIKDCDIEYHGLYPRSWTVFRIPEIKIRIVCQQISPFIPHNYEDSSLPCSTFVWTIYDSETEYKVRIFHTVESGFGRRNDHNKSFVQSYKNTLQLHQTLPKNHLRHSYVLSAKGGTIGYHLFDSKSNGSTLFSTLEKCGF